MRFGIDSDRAYSLEEIAAHLKVSLQYIRSVECNALDKMRDFFKSRQISFSDFSLASYPIPTIEHYIERSAAHQALKDSHAPNSTSVPKGDASLKASSSLMAAFKKHVFRNLSIVTLLMSFGANDAKAAAGLMSGDLSDSNYLGSVSATKTTSKMRTPIREIIHIGQEHDAPCDTCSVEERMTLGKSCKIAGCCV